MCVQNGFVECVDVLINKGALVGTRCGLDEQTSLHLACRLGSLKMVTILLNSGGDIEDTSLVSIENMVFQTTFYFRFQCGFTALHFACARGASEIADFLIKKGANVKARDQVFCSSAFVD